MINIILIFLCIFFSSASIAKDCSANKKSLQITPVKMNNSFNKMVEALKSKYLKPKSWSIPYFERDLAGAPANEILCITSRTDKNPLVVGHTALSRFSLNQPQTEKDLKSSSVDSFGLWPLKQSNKNSSDKDRVNFLKNDPSDHFLNFEYGQGVKDKTRFCVTINKEESKKLDNFIIKQKKAVWDLAYNCNDISSEAFKLVTGISFKSRSMTTAYLSTPGTMLNSIKKHIKNLKNYKKFKYVPKDSDEVKKLIELNLKEKLKVVPFK